MDIFLSFSGERSKRVASALKEWLPVVLSDEVKPWLSKEIGAGERWSHEVAQKLQETNFGIICLTRDNLDARWIHFEAGALSKVLDESYVCPYLLDISFSEIGEPLSQFQAKRTNKKDTFELLKSVGSVFPKPLDEISLSKRFEALWPELENELKDIPEDQGGEHEAPRPVQDVLEELVETVRSVDRRVGNLDTRLTLFESEPEPYQGIGESSKRRSWWDMVVSHMRESRNMPAAAVFGEAMVTHVSENTLALTFPKDLAIYAKLATDIRHLEVLKDALDSTHGWRPDVIECRVEDS